MVTLPGAAPRRPDRDAGGSADLAPMLARLCPALKAALPSAARVEMHVNLYPVTVEPGAATLLCLAAQELIRNALTHAHPTGRGGVGVHLWPTDGTRVPSGYLLVADDGRGFATELPAAEGSGLSRARHYVEQAGGSLVREPGSGTVWRIGLP